MDGGDVLESDPLARLAFSRDPAAPDLRQTRRQIPRHAYDTGRPPSSRSPLLRSSVMLAAGITFSGGHRSSEARRVENAFYDLADERAAAIQRNVAVQLTVLDAIGAFFDASQRVERSRIRGIRCTDPYRPRGVRSLGLGPLRSGT